MNLIMNVVAALGGKLVDRLFPDPEQRARAQIELIKLTHEHESRAMADDLARDLAQAKINEVEAASSGVFRGGWRPFVGWVCGVGFAVHFVAAPLLPWLVHMATGREVASMPAVDIDTLLTMLTAMLGLGGMRSFERIKGRA